MLTAEHFDGRNQWVWENKANGRDYLFVWRGGSNQGDWRHNPSPNWGYYIYDKGTYFNLIQPLQHNLGNTLSFSKMQDNKDINGTYYVYSFSLYPTIKQPSGLCNLSRIDDKILQLNIKYINNNNHNNNITTNIFSVNYNYLIIQNGKGKLEYI